MADIKTKVRGKVKTLDKSVNTSARIKSNIVSTKDKWENTYNPDGENEVEYASNKISNGTNIATNKIAITLIEKALKFLFLFFMIPPIFYIIAYPKNYFNILYIKKRYF